MYMITSQLERPESRSVKHFWFIFYFFFLFFFCDDTSLSKPKWPRLLFSTLIPFARQIVTSASLLRAMIIEEQEEAEAAEEQEEQIRKKK